MIGLDKMSNEKMKLFNMSVYDYLVLSHKHLSAFGVCYKLSGAITCKQVVLGIGLGNKIYHNSLMEYVISNISPGDSNYNIRFDYDSVKMFAFDYFFTIHLPRNISYQQYKMIEDIIGQVKKYEKDYNIKIKTYPEFELVLKEARRRLNNWSYIERGEKIVGMSINEQFLIDSIISELEIEKCNNIKYFRRAVKILLKYYRDAFFKDVIVKMVSNDEYYDNIFRKIFEAFENFDDQELENEIKLLIEKELQKRDEWGENSSSYDLYSYYKRSIRDRLEFEKVREEFDKKNHNHDNQKK